MSLLRACCQKNYMPTASLTTQCAFRAVKWFAISGALWAAQATIHSQMNDQIKYPPLIEKMPTCLAIGKWGAGMIGTGYAGLALLGTSVLISCLRQDKYLKSRS